MQRKEVLKISISIIFLASLLTIFFITPPKNVTGNAIESNGNLEIDLPSNYKQVSPGEKIYFTTKILNLAQEQRKDVTLKFEIIDNKNNQIVTKSKTVAIETQASFVSNLDIPKETKEGKYTLKVTMIRNGLKELEGETNFLISNEKTLTTTFLKNKILFSTLAIAIILIVFFIVSRKKIKKYFRKRKIKNKIETIIKIRNQK